MRKQLGISALALVIVAAGGGLAQDRQSAPMVQESRPNLAQRLLDSIVKQLSQAAQQNDQTKPDAAAGVIDFEDVEGAADGAGIRLDKQYDASHGVSFGPGVSVHFCQQSSDDVMSSLCSYPQAASGRRAAVYDPRSGDAAAMTMNFSRAVQAVSFRINPTGGRLDETFLVNLIGFDVNGARVASSSQNFVWRQDAFTWPTVIGFETGGANFARVTVELRATSQNNQPVRFLFDDLALSYSVEPETAPVFSDLTEQRRPTRIGNADVVQSPEMREVQDELRLYPAATRIRVPIDWETAEIAAAEQAAQGMAAPAFNGAAFADRAELPLLLPRIADPGSLNVVGNRDAYSATFSAGGRDYAFYGSRVLTLVNPAGGAPSRAENVQLIEGDDALTASFSLYGASYTLTRYCLEDWAPSDPACHDAEALGDVAASMMVHIGAAGRGRP